MCALIFLFSLQIIPLVAIVTVDAGRVYTFAMTRPNYVKVSYGIRYLQTFSSERSRGYFAVTATGIIKSPQERSFFSHNFYNQTIVGIVLLVSLQLCMAGGAHGFCASLVWVILLFRFTKNSHQKIYSLSGWVFSPKKFHVSVFILDSLKWSYSNSNLIHKSYTIKHTPSFYIWHTHCDTQLPSCKPSLRRDRADTSPSPQPG